jgi:tetratricopeptide (TPR) repeat protein
MFFYSLLASIAILFFGCSASKESYREEKDTKVTSVTPSDEISRNALEHFINGNVAQAKGDYATAIIEFQDALRLDPNAGIYYALAKNYLFLNKLSLALQNAKMSVELNPNKIEYQDLLADIYSTAHQTDSAAVVLEKIISLDSANLSAYYKLGRLYESSKPLRAIEIYEKLTNIIGPDWNVLIRTAELYERLGRITDAVNSIEQLLKIDPSNTPLQKLLIEYYQRANMNEQALDVVNEIIEFTPDDLDARERKAQILISLGDWEKAAKEYDFILKQKDVPLELKVRVGASYFNRALKDSSLMPIAKEFFSNMDKDTLDWQIKMYLGAIAISEKNDSAAIVYFKYVTENARWNVDAWIRLGGLYFDNRKYDETAKIMYEAVEIFPQDFIINLILGLSLSQNGKYTESEPYLKTAVDLNPGDINAISSYAYTLSQLKRNDEAESYLKKALIIAPNDVNLLGTLGLIYDSEERWAECDSVYKAALQIESENPLINNNYAYSLSERNERLEEALKMAEIAVEAEPNNSSYLDTIGWVFFKLGDYPKAKFYLEKAIEVGGEKPVMLEHLGDVLFMMGEKENALELWQKALTLDSTNDSLKTKIQKGEI